MPAAPPPEAPYAISTLGAIGTAAQDPGGGGGGTGAPGNVAPPAIQGAQGSGSAQGFADAGDTLYFSGVNLLDPNRSATTSGQTTFGGPGRRQRRRRAARRRQHRGRLRHAAAGDRLLRHPAAQRGDVPRQPPGPPQHQRGRLGDRTALPADRRAAQCQLVGQGTAPISGGIANVTLGVRRPQLPHRGTRPPWCHGPTTAPRTPSRPAAATRATCTCRTSGLFDVRRPARHRAPPGTPVRR